MDINVHVNFSENIANAILALAAAIEGGGGLYQPTEVGHAKAEPIQIAEPAPEQVAAPVVEELPDPEPSLWTTEQVRDKVRALLTIDNGVYALDVKGALTQCGADSLSKLSGCNYNGFMELLSDLFEKHNL